MATGAQAGAPPTPSRPVGHRQASGLTRGDAIELDSTDASESSFRWSDSGIGEDTIAGSVDDADTDSQTKGKHELMLLPTERSEREETPLMPGEYRRGRSKSW